MTDGTYRGLGIASLILKHLMTIAREAGISLFDGEVRNRSMLAVFRSASSSALPSFCRANLERHSMRQSSGAETIMETMLDPDQCKGEQIRLVIAVLSRLPS